MTTPNPARAKALLSLAITGSLVITWVAHVVPRTRLEPGDGEPTLAEVRTATERFRDVKVALAEGYIRDPFDLCETATMMGQPEALGAMGVHYFHPDLLGITEPPSPRVDGVGTHTDFRRPSILIYEPQDDGSLELVAVENLVFSKSWRATGQSVPPTFHGVPYDTMTDDPTTGADEAHMFAPHFDRHVWIYRDNPNGVFAPFNPAVTCEHHRAAPDHAATRSSHEGSTSPSGPDTGTSSISPTGEYPDPVTDSLTASTPEKSARRAATRRIEQCLSQTQVRAERGTQGGPPDGEDLIDGMKSRPLWPTVSRW